MNKRNPIETKCSCGERIGKGWYVWFQDDHAVCDNCEMKLRQSVSEQDCDSQWETAQDVS